MDFRILGLMALMTALYGCGGNDGKAVPAPEPVKPDAFGQIIDSSVSGLRVVSGDYEGVSDASGTFGYKNGQLVQFYVGDIAVGSAVTPKAVLTPLELAQNDPSIALNIARFLQSLDNDGNPENGIEIDETSHQKAQSQSVDFSSIYWSEPATAGNPIAELMHQLTSETEFGARYLIASEDAYSHFASTLDGFIDEVDENISNTVSISGCEQNNQCAVVELISPTVNHCPPLPEQRVYSQPTTNADLLGELVADRSNIIDAKAALFFYADASYSESACDPEEQPTIAMCTTSGNCELRDYVPDAHGQFRITQGVAGIRVVSGYYESVTDEEGSFGYLQGETVQFFIGDIALGAPILPQAILTPLDLVAEDPVAALNLTRFLQSLDSDDNIENGLQIAASTSDLARGESLDFHSEEWFSADQESSSIAQLLFHLTSQTEAGARYPVDATTVYTQLTAILDSDIEALATQVDTTLQTASCEENNQCLVYRLASSDIAPCRPLPQRFAYAASGTDTDELASITEERDAVIAVKTEIYNRSHDNDKTDSCFEFEAPLLPMCNDGGYCELVAPEPDGYGQLLDSKVSGVRVISGDYEGLTDENGMFGYKQGERVQFFVGDIAIGQPVEPKAVLTPIDLANNDGLVALNIARFLQTLDDDAQPDNGIQVVMSSHILATGNTVDFLSDEWRDAHMDNSVIGQLLMILTSETTAGSRAAVSDYSAYRHFASTLDGFVSNIESQIDEALNISGCTNNNQCKEYSLPTAAIDFPCTPDPEQLLYSETSTDVSLIDTLASERSQIIENKTDVYYSVHSDGNSTGLCIGTSPFYHLACNAQNNCERRDGLPIIVVD